MNSTVSSSDTVGNNRYINESHWLVLFIVPFAEGTIISLNLIGHNKVSISIIIKSHPICENDYGIEQTRMIIPDTSPHRGCGLG